jgi:copper(I)-binding protein
MRAFVIACFTLAAAACGAPPEPASESPAPAPQAAALEIGDAWAPPTPGGVDISGGYLNISNATAEDDRLIAAASPRAERVEIHEMAMDGAIMRMRRIEALVVPAGEAVTMEPGGMHLMFFGVTEPFTEGEQIPVTLTFERGGEIQTLLTVRAGGSAEQ